MSSTKPNDLEAKRSAVRRNVTYLMVVAFILFTGMVLATVLWIETDIKTALAVLASFATPAGVVLGFWYGKRSAEKAGG